MERICENCKFWRHGDCLNPEVQKAVFTYDYQIVFSRSFGCIFWKQEHQQDPLGGNTVEPMPYRQKGDS